MGSTPVRDNVGFVSNTQINEHKHIYLYKDVLQIFTHAQTYNTLHITYKNRLSITYQVYMYLQPYNSPSANPYTIFCHQLSNPLGDFHKLLALQDNPWPTHPISFFPQVNIKPIPWHMLANIAPYCPNHHFSGFSQAQKRDWHSSLNNSSNNNNKPV